MVDIATSYSNYEYHCPVINETVNTDLRIDPHKIKSSRHPNEKLELGVFKNIEYCSGIGKCGVKTIHNDNAIYNWDICPLQKKLSKE